MLSQASTRLPIMKTNDAANAYMTASVETAPPLKIVRMLYEGALRFLARGETSGVETSEGRAWIGRADAIVKELRISLDPNRDPEICEQLQGLYLFCEDEFARSMAEQDVDALANAREVLEILKDAWVQAGASTTTQNENAA